MRSLCVFLANGTQTSWNAVTLCIPGQWDKNKPPQIQIWPGKEGNDSSTWLPRHPNPSFHRSQPIGFSRNQARSFNPFLRYSKNTTVVITVWPDKGRETCMHREQRKRAFGVVSGPDTKFEWRTCKDPRCLLVGRCKIKARTSKSVVLSTPDLALKCWCCYFFCDHLKLPHFFGSLAQTERGSVMALHMAPWRTIYLHRFFDWKKMKQQFGIRKTKAGNFRHDPSMRHAHGT